MPKMTFALCRYYVYSMLRFCCLFSAEDDEEPMQKRTAHRLTPKLFHSLRHYSFRCFLADFIAGLTVDVAYSPATARARFSRAEASLS